MKVCSNLKKLKWKYEPFEIPKEILNKWRAIGEKGELYEKKWNAIFNEKSDKIKKELSRILNKKLPDAFDKLIEEQKKSFLI